MQKKTIFVTNDDGILAPSLAALSKAASKFGRVVVVAPDRNRSAISSAMSVHDILRLDEISQDCYACSGTPVDCVLMGLRHVLSSPPDWVLSGINWGYNLAEDVIYSGTVGAAFEGRLHGARCAAFSLCRSGDLGVAEKWVELFLANWEKIELPQNSIWNVNFPESDPKGFRLTTQGRRSYFDLMEQRTDPRGKPYFWIGGEGVPEYAKHVGTDAEAIHNGYASVTPLNMDLTCQATIANGSLFDDAFKK